MFRFGGIGVPLWGYRCSALPRNHFVSATYNCPLSSPELPKEGRGGTGVDRGARLRLTPGPAVPDRLPLNPHFVALDTFPACCVAARRNWRNRGVGRRGGRWHVVPTKLRRTGRRGVRGFPCGVHPFARRFPPLGQCLRGFNWNSARPYRER